MALVAIDHGDRAGGMGLGADEFALYRRISLFWEAVDPPGGQVGGGFDPLHLHTQCAIKNPLRFPASCQRPVPG